MLVKMLETVNEPQHTYSEGTQHDVSPDKAMQWFIDRKASPVRPPHPANAREKAIPPTDHRETRNS